VMFEESDPKSSTSSSNKYILPVLGYCVPPLITDNCEMDSLPKYCEIETIINSVKIFVNFRRTDQWRLAPISRGTPTTINVQSRDCLRDGYII
jgi:hypothetical protein